MAHRDSRRLRHGLVAANRLRNEVKSASIAGLDHPEHWLARSQESDDSLGELASILGWPRKRDRTIATARAVYLWLPSQARLWIAGTEFEALDITRARALLTASISDWQVALSHRGARGRCSVRRRPARD
jgi:hypothetical protein